MPTLVRDTPVNVYVPLGCSITFTPDAGSKISINGRTQDGSAIAPADIYSATAVAFPAGSNFTAIAEGGGGSYTDPALTASEVASVRSLVSGAGNPTDLLTGTLQRVTITGAMSTTATQAAAATGTYTKARVVWNNNGASGTAKLRIAVNADNDVHGLMIGQNVKRRDYEMTMGDGVMLVCGVPITRLTFSADGSITGGTHQLQVTFGN